MPLLSHPDERIVYEVLAFLEAILEYGNSHVQEGLKEVIGSRQQVFPTLNAIVKKASIVYEERYRVHIILSSCACNGLSIALLCNWTISEICSFLCFVFWCRQLLITIIKARNVSDQKIVRQ